jgi:DMSO/TMAO reductase YedYZ heme-binding membrane subunit
MRAIVLHPYMGATISIVLEVVAALVPFGWGIDGLEAVARYSGRAGLLWFGLVFLISPMHRFAPGDLTRLALRQRRNVGLAFGYHHFVHLAFLLTYVSVSGKGINVARTLPGIVGYVFLFVMMATSSDEMVTRIGRRNRRRLHLTCLWYLWFIFLLTYVVRLVGMAPNVGGGTIEFVVCISFVLALAFARISAFAVSRRASASVAVAG